MIYDDQIFDINHKDPLPLTKQNIDLCCVGNQWTFQGFSRICVFEPTTKLKNFLDDNTWYRAEVIEYNEETGENTLEYVAV